MKRLSRNRILLCFCLTNEVSIYKFNTAVRNPKTNQLIKKKDSDVCMSYQNTLIKFTLMGKKQFVQWSCNKPNC